MIDGPRATLRLLQVTGTLDPEYGGPPVVVNQLTSALGANGFDVDVVTLDEPSSPWLADVPGNPVALGFRMAGYRYNHGLVDWLRTHVDDYDAVIVHGIWQYQSVAVRSVCRRQGVPYFVFVHGALDPWFAERYPRKHAKKSLYWKLIERRVLRDARAVLYTCDEERRLAATAFTPYRATEAIVNLGIAEPPGDADRQVAAFYAAHPHLRGRRITLFLSRLHPKKGCDLLIRAFAESSRSEPHAHLVLAGPDSDGTMATLVELVDALGIAERVTWAGMITGDVKWGAYRAADVFALTSHSENFGIVLAEALACALPVLITDKVNIWREIVGAGAGFVAPDTEAGARELLDGWAALSDAQRNDVRERARSCFVDNFEARHAGLVCARTIAAAIGKADHA
ncbi:glycosyltransferase [Mycolicibacterium sediminis]|uniref:Glycosyl transferase n=1 Tax=Mycolicibacterium sediminis TaxID=1286180 RepID=A0A7I7QQF5_9MYCO|nr:glycosyltransferase [Mycolicibacterium sediminis]BBY28619.1 glycosyl transferase [Mycolicibacterium sediminis]